MTTAIDLFAGLGGWSTGARAAGVKVLWGRQPLARGREVACSKPPGHRARLPGPAPGALGTRSPPRSNSGFAMLPGTLEGPRQGVRESSA